MRWLWLAWCKNTYDDHFLSIISGFRLCSSFDIMSEPSSSVVSPITRFLVPLNFVEEPQLQVTRQIKSPLARSGLVGLFFRQEWSGWAGFSPGVVWLGWFYTVEP